MVTIDHGWFRGLYEELVRRRDAEERRRLLHDLSRSVAVRLAALAPLQEREQLPRDPSTVRDEPFRTRQWAMYALSRTSDHLLELGCPAGDPDDARAATGGRRLVTELALHERFFSAVGLEVFEHRERFSPFHHEIFAVERDETAAEVTLEEVLWPGFRFGTLLFCRAGVRVRAPSRLVDTRVATTSTLYFTFRRHPRPANDPSHGWGSNSQWRTRFARFYDDAEGLHLNWDGGVDIGVDAPAPPPDRFDPNDGRPVERRRELLLYRCLVRNPRPSDENDWYPYSDRLSLSRDAARALLGPTGIGQC